MWGARACPVTGLGRGVFGRRRASYPDVDEVEEGLGPGEGALDPAAEGGGTAVPRYDCVSWSGDDEHAATMSSDPGRSAPAEPRHIARTRRRPTPSTRRGNEVTPIQ
jgi:hypothetical protein